MAAGLIVTALGTSDTISHHGLELAPKFSQDFDEESGPPTAKTRLEKWQRKLLDLTLRNKLLNFKGEGRKSVKFFSPDSAALEDKIADEVEIRITPVPKVSDAFTCLLECSVD